MNRRRRRLTARARPQRIDGALSSPRQDGRSKAPAVAASVRTIPLEGESGAPKTLGSLLESNFILGRRALRLEGESVQPRQNFTSPIPGCKDPGGRGGLDGTNQVFLFPTGVCPGERPGAGAAEGRGSTIGTAQPQPQHFTVSAGSDAA